MTARPSPSRLYRNRRKGKIMGVCAGIADYFGVSPLPLRIAAILGLVFATFPTLVIYFVAAWVLNDTPEDLFASEEEARFWKSVRTEPSGTARALRHKFRGLEQRLRAVETQVTSSEFALNRKFRDIDP